MGIFAFLRENWESIVTVLLAIHGVAVAIANMTDTPRDDQWVGRAYKVIELAAGIGRKAKQQAGEKS